MAAAVFFVAGRAGAAGLAPALARAFDVVLAGLVVPLVAEAALDAAVLARGVASAGVFLVVVATVERVAALLRPAERVRSLPGDVTVCPL